VGETNGNMFFVKRKKQTPTQQSQDTLLGEQPPRRPTSTMKGQRRISPLELLHSHLLLMLWAAVGGSKGWMLFKTRNVNDAGW